MISKQNVGQNEMQLCVIQFEFTEQEKILCDKRVRKPKT